MWVPAEVPRFGGAKSCNRGVDAVGQVVMRQQLKQRYVLKFFEKAAALPGWHRSLCLVASLVARAPGSWSHRSPDAAGLREVLCQAAQE